MGRCFVMGRLGRERRLVSDGAGIMLTEAMMVRLD